MSDRAATPEANLPNLRPVDKPPLGAKVVTLDYLVPFYDTDAMGVVHHANYVRYLELGRVRFLEERDTSYDHYVSQGIHVVVTRVDARYHRAAQFNQLLTITSWLNWVKGVSLGFGYVINHKESLLVSGITEHAIINQQGRPVRIPKDRRRNLSQLVPDSNS